MMFDRIGSATADPETMAARDQRIRILFCTSDFELGGTQRHLGDLVGQLDPERFDVTVAAIVARGPWRDRLAERGASIEEIPIRRALWHPKSLREILRFSRGLRGRFDVVHTMLGYANVVGLLGGALARTRGLIASQRCFDPEFGGSMPGQNPLLGKFADFLIHRAASRVVVNNPAIRDALAAARVPRERIVYVPTSVDLTRFRPVDDRAAAKRSLGLDPERPVAGFVSRFVRAKGAERVVRAAALLVPRIPGLQVVLAGDGPDRAAIERAIDDARLGDRVRLLGMRSDVEAILPAFDVFVFPSTYAEGTPNVVVEAMASGVPVVVHAIPQLEAIVTGESTGLVVDAERDTNLAEAVERVLTDEPLARKLAISARARVETHHSLAEEVRILSALYEEVAAEAAPSTRGARRGPGSESTRRADSIE